MLRAYDCFLTLSILGGTILFMSGCSQGNPRPESAAGEDDHSHEGLTDGHGEPPALHGEMTSAPGEGEEEQLYLSPGGKYTVADIVANGRVTASQKFANFSPKHDLRPKQGEKICPVTLTKANPQCSWIVGGKTYQFCCPPCVEEFVKLAKDDPAEIKEPDDYVKR